MKKNNNYIWKLGMFVIIGLFLFVVTIYFIGKTRNLFGETFQLKSVFKNVSGLKIGNNVRLSGINIGTVKEIEFETDSTVIVTVVIKEEMLQYIKTDAIASIGSDGLMGDKVLTISPGKTSNKAVKNNNTIASTKAIEMEDLMKSVKVSVDNAAIITNELAVFSQKMNNNDGALSKIMNDKKLAQSIENTLFNIETGTEGFASFTSKMNNNNSVLSKFTTDEKLAKSLENAFTNIENGTQNFSTFTNKINNTNSIFSKLATDEKMGKSLDSTFINIQDATKGLNENMEALKHNFLFRGYFNKKKKAAAKKAKAIQEATQKEADNKTKLLKK
ncbi:MlaD family protein [Flavobacterium dankookense]|uniref:Phospholipid/cholesterol/gamma-HCH transport system substrate-binding protein n=1 Tax=Flavobacterium dankookense TaxID=706186 RepID=A0A4R6QH74_9FLAO|nr:MlaD family protein [Flavobacterium dankookense]TDP60929.1 phospholipid/cholesterol/gamma-HCH transport system substrate-binding protein [Flavobacterium dankookense]